MEHSGWVVTGIGVKKFGYVDPARAPGVRNKYGYEERTVSIFSASTGRWSSTQWVPSDALWRSEAKARTAYSEARQAAQSDRSMPIQMIAVRLREERRAAGEFDAHEAA